MTVIETSACIWGDERSSTWGVEMRKWHGDHAQETRLSGSTSESVFCSDEHNPE